MLLGADSAAGAVGCGETSQCHGNTSTSPSIHHQQPGCCQAQVSPLQHCQEFGNKRCVIKLPLLMPWPCLRSGTDSLALQLWWRRGEQVSAHCSRLSAPTGILLSAAWGHAAAELPSMPHSGGSWGWRHLLHAAGKPGSKGTHIGESWGGNSFTLLRQEYRGGCCSCHL